MRKFRLTVAVLAVLFTVSLVCFAASVGPAQFDSVTGASVDGNGNLAEISGNAVLFEKNIAAEIKSVLGENGGTLNISFSVTPQYKEGESGNISYSIALNGQGNQSGEFTVSAEDAKKSNQRLSVTVMGIEAEKLESIRIGNTVISGTPAEVPSISPDVSPSAESSPSASEGTTPTVSTTTTPSATPNITPKPTNSNSGTTYERTNDPYDGSGRVTNAPPSIVAEVDISDIDIAEPVQDEITPVPDASLTEKIDKDPATGLTVLFLVLLLFLIADIAVILWRKKLGFGGLLNGGIVHRKVRDDLCDYPVDTANTEKTDDGFDNDLDDE